MLQERRKFSDEEKLQIIREWMESGESKEVFQARKQLGHCAISRWMTIFGVSEHNIKEAIEEMKKDKKKPKSAEVQMLEAENARLKRELEHEKLRSLAFSTMIDVAESELGIDIRKKSGAKQ